MKPPTSRRLGMFAGRLPPIPNGHAMTDVATARWAWVVVALSGCFQTGPIDLVSEDRETTTDTLETRETTRDVVDEVMPGTPCIAVSDLSLSFGALSAGQSAKMTLTVTACGPRTLRVALVDIVDDVGGRFSVVSQTSGVIRPNDTMEIVIRYTAGSAEPRRDGSPKVDRGVLELVSDGHVPRLRVDLDGYSAACPVARIISDQGPVVPMGIALQLDGRASTTSLSEVAAYRWTVAAPFGSVATFAPSASAVAPTFLLDAEGSYTFRLDIIDALGGTSCVAAVHEVTAVRDMHIYVQLTWDTPGDPDQRDVSAPNTLGSAGSDMDLHFLSPNAGGAYFGSNDCYYANRNPEWGIFGAADNPTMHRDDTDGAGPETIGVSDPEDGVRYQVGVHYYDDWAYGDSVATLRVYIDGELRDAWSAPMAMDDMWHTHTIDWPSGIVTRIGTTPHITPNYYY